MNVIGVCSTGHGAAIALASEKYGVRAMTLDRFTGHKHSMLFLRRELEDITSCANPIDRSIYEALSYSYRKFPRSFVVEETFIPFLRALLRGLPLRPDQIDLVVTSNSHFAFNVGRVGNLLRHIFPNARIINNLEHHTIHQWQAYLASGFSDSAVLTLDESGESLLRLGGRKIAMTLSIARDCEMRVLKEHFHPGSSPGLMYAEVCRHIGYCCGEEGKLMGLAPYGTDKVYRALVPELKLFEDGSFELLPSDELCRRLNRFQPRRLDGFPLEPIHADIAYAAQRLLEDILVNAMQALDRMAPDDVLNVCVAGGVALNSCANEKMFRASRFREIYISPNPGDDGHALACALYGLRVAGKIPATTGIPTDYLGPAYSDDEIKQCVLRNGMEIHDSDPDVVAAMLDQERIVAIFQGGSEYGPRALGNRTILADPRNAEMATIVNELVKHRELFRPYAPIALEEKAHLWFDHKGPNRFMLRVVPVLPEKRRQLGAITHIDGSARLQTLDRASNPRLYGIIEAFERRTGIPVLLNTSFNLAGKPIVETPQDAIDCFAATGIDVLILGKYMLVKSAFSSSDAGSPEEQEKKVAARKRYRELQQHALNGAGARQVDEMMAMSKAN